jgi:hypothetical protein
MAATRTMREMMPYTGLPRPTAITAAHIEMVALSRTDLRVDSSRSG